MSAILFSGEQMSGHGDTDVVCFLPISPSGRRQSWPLNRLILSSPVAILFRYGRDCLHRKLRFINPVTCNHVIMFTRVRCAFEPLM